MTEREEEKKKKRDETRNVFKDRKGKQPWKGMQMKYIKMKKVKKEKEEQSGGKEE